MKLKRILLALLATSSIVFVTTSCSSHKKEDSNGSKKITNVSMNSSGIKAPEADKWQSAMSKVTENPDWDSQSIMKDLTSDALWKASGEEKTAEKLMLKVEETNEVPGKDDSTKGSNSHVMSFGGKNYIAIPDKGLNFYVFNLLSRIARYSNVSKKLFKFSNSDYIVLNAHNETPTSTDNIKRKKLSQQILTIKLMNYLVGYDWAVDMSGGFFWRLINSAWNEGKPPLTVFSVAGNGNSYALREENKPNWMQALISERKKYLTIVEDEPSNSLNYSGSRVISVPNTRLGTVAINILHKLALFSNKLSPLLEEVETLFHTLVSFEANITIMFDIIRDFNSATPRENINKYIQNEWLFEIKMMEYWILISEEISIRYNKFIESGSKPNSPESASLEAATNAKNFWISWPYNLRRGTTDSVKIENTLNFFKDTSATLLLNRPRLSN